MRLARSFALIGAGAFAAGVLYSQTAYDHRFGIWALVAAALAVAIVGLFDLIVFALRSPPPVWVKPSH